MRRRAAVAEALALVRAADGRMTALACACVAMVLVLQPASAGTRSPAPPLPEATGASAPGAQSSAPAPGSVATEDPAHAASPEVHHVTRWVRASGDNARMPYIIVDKVNATVFVFDRDGYLKGAQPALLGMAHGDRTAPHVGTQSLTSLRPEDRTTPAGRFVASIDRDVHGQSILWFDYDNALAMHRVAKGTPTERRAERLQSVTASDNRISYGCINVPVPFFDTLIAPAFKGSGGVVYILPEQTPVQDLFGGVGVDGPSAALE